MAVQYLQPTAQAQERSGPRWEHQPPADDDGAANEAPSGDLAERLARWTIAYLTALAASLSLVGGAWALGLIAW